MTRRRVVEPEHLLRYYRLRNGVPERCTLYEWADAWKDRVLRTSVTPSGWVMTIFEGHDPYAYEHESDRLFCTGVFDLHGRCVVDERCLTQEEAFAMHDRRAARFPHPLAFER